MAGHKRRRGDAWQLIVTVPAPGGQSRQITRTFKGGERQADRALARFVTEVADGRHAGKAGTLAELIDEWLAVSGHEASTLHTERRDLVRYILPTLGARQVRSIRPADLTAFYRRLRDGGGRDGAPLSAATVERVHSLIRRSFVHGLETEWCQTNPAASARRPKDDTRRAHHPPTLGELGRLLETAALESPLWAVFLRLAATTGARRGELCALRWSDIDLERGLITIAHSIGYGADGNYLKAPKTDRVRVVPVGPDTLETLAALPQTVGYVFSLDPDGTFPWPPKAVTKRFDRTRRAAGVTCRLHDLRHFTATHLHAAGVPDAIGAKRLGHSRISTYTDVYGHTIDAQEIAAAVTIDRIVAGP